MLGPETPPYTHPLSWSAFKALAVIILTFGFLCMPSRPAVADSEREARNLRPQITALISEKKFSEAAAAAQHGLTLCEDAGTFTRFCTGLFNEFLGDIADAQSNYTDALTYYQRSLESRKSQLGSRDKLVGFMGIKVGKTELALRRYDAAEISLKGAVQNFETRTPVEQDLGTALFYLLKVYVAVDRPDDALAVGRRSLAIYLETQGPNGKSVAGAKKYLGSVLILLGHRDANKQAYADAEKSLREGLELFDPPLPGWEHEFAEDLHILGKIYQIVGNFTDAEAYELKALNYYQSSAEPTNDLLVWILLGLAEHHYLAGKLNDAENYAQRIVTAFDNAKQQNQWLISALLWAGRSQVSLGHYADAETTYKRLFSIIDQNVSEDDERHAFAFKELGTLHAAEDKYVQAEQEFRAALELDDKFKYRDTWIRPQILGFLSMNYKDMAKYSEAEQCLLQATKIDETAASSESRSYLARHLSLLASVYRRESRYPEAIDLFARAQGIATTDEDRAEILNSLGLTYSNIGRPDKAEPALREALALEQKALPPNARLTLDTLTNLAEIDLAEGRFVEAEAKHREILSAIEARELPGSTAIALHEVLLADALVRTGKLDEAATLAKNALARNESHLGVDHPRTSGAIKLLASIEVLYGNDHAAENLYRRALAGDGHSFGEGSSAVANDLVDLAPVLQRMGNHQEALSGLTRATEMLKTQFGDASPLTVGALLASADMAYSEGRFSEAQDFESRAQKIKEQTRGLDDPSMIGIWIFNTRMDIATNKIEAAHADIARAAGIAGKSLPSEHPFNIDVLHGKADLASARGDLAGAERYDREALTLADKLFGSDHPIRTGSVDRLIGALAAEGKLDEAETLSGQALALGQERFGPDDLRTGGALKRLASIEMLRSKDADAAIHYRRALAIDERALGLQHATVAGDLITLASILQRLGKREEAKTDTDRALTITTARFGNDSPMSVGALQAVANLALDDAHYKEARGLVEHIQQVQENSLGPDHTALVHSLIFVTRLDIAEGELGKAGAAIDRAAQITGQSLPSEHPFNIDVLHGKADLASARGDLAGAERHDREALALADKVFGSDHPIRTGSVDRLVSVLWANDKHPEAEKIRRSELANVQQKRGDGDPLTAPAIRGLAAILANSGRIRNAIMLYESALKLDEQALGPLSREAALDNIVLGSTFTVVGQFDDAQKALRRARTIAESQSNLLLSAATLDQLAQLAAIRGDFAEGAVHMEAEVKVLEQNFGAVSPALVAGLAQLGRLYLITNRVTDATKVMERITGLIGKNPPEQSPGFLSCLLFQAMLEDDRHDVDNATATFKRAIFVATKYGGRNAAEVALIRSDLAIAYLKEHKFDEAINEFSSALEGLHAQFGEHALIMGYVQAAAAAAYEGKGDHATSEKLSSSAARILGPTVGTKSQPRWL
jgi:tetratricopeptide (TPR) repeat protein